MVWAILPDAVADPPSPPVTVVIVSYDTRELLLGCLDSLRADAIAGTAEVWVVDNGSRDGSAAAARTHAPWARVLVPGANLGYGAAVELVAARTTSPWLLAANADVALAPGALGVLLAAGRDPQVGCLAPRLILPDGTPQHSVFAFPTVWTAIAFNLGLAGVVPGLGERLCLPGHWRPDRERDVPWALGACLLLRRTAYRQVGGFDPTMWLYAEDIDLGWRLADGGWRTRYVPAARVRHEGSVATAAAFGARRFTRFLAATYALLVRRRGRARAAITLAVNIMGAAARVAWLTPRAARPGSTRARWRENQAWLVGHLRSAPVVFTLWRA
jgi:GT2 family glycosyltransferase